MYPGLVGWHGRFETFGLALGRKALMVDECLVGGGRGGGVMPLRGEGLGEEGEEDKDAAWY